jgi:hypothetical protein
MIIVSGEILRGGDTPQNQFQAGSLVDMQDPRIGHMICALTEPDVTTRDFWALQQILRKTADKLRIPAGS